MVDTEESVGRAAARLVAYAEETIAYEEAAAERDGLTPDETWAEWQRSKDILTLRGELLRLRGGGAVTGLPEGVLSVEECLEWADRYKAIPMNALALTATMDKTHSPMAVFSSLVWHARATLSAGATDVGAAD